METRPAAPVRDPSTSDLHVKMIAQLDVFSITANSVMYLAASYIPPFPYTVMFLLKHDLVFPYKVNEISCVYNSPADSPVSLWVWCCRLWQLPRVQALPLPRHSPSLEQDWPGLLRRRHPSSAAQNRPRPHCRSERQRSSPPRSEVSWNRGHRSDHWSTHQLGHRSDGRSGFRSRHETRERPGQVSGNHGP